MNSKDIIETIPAVWMSEIRKQIDLILNGGSLFEERVEIVDVSKLSDEQVMELWKSLDRDPMPPGRKGSYV